MRIRAQRDDLADVLARANRAVGARTALPVLQGLLCEVSGTTLRVTGTDLDVTVRTSAEVEVMEEGTGGHPGPSPLGGGAQDAGRGGDHRGE